MRPAHRRTPSSDLWPAKPGEWQPPRWLVLACYAAGTLLGGWLAQVGAADPSMADNHLAPPLMGGFFGWLAALIVLRLCEAVSDLRHGRPIF
ncbi:hypothetical protein M0638_27335 [Roseomonas sp. NAR14]|uniref:Uncharacterized protein n=1 Tax=Roseomonas acroporae TaxID=2937791 RepID=A0A9X1YC60_9PROT|nr:hypothetical protein [Roseomonas acroporae]MCK8788074.1 hypothetical protein [Roseomonas acroporae]